MKILTLVLLFIFFGCSKPEETKGVPLNRCFLACPVTENLQISDCVGLKILEYRDGFFVVYSKYQFDVLHKDVMGYIMRLSKEFPCPKE